MNDENRRIVLAESIKITEETVRLRADCNKLIDEANRLFELRGRIETHKLSEALEATLTNHVKTEEEVYRAIISNLELNNRYMEALHSDFRSMGISLPNLSFEMWPETIDEK